MTHRRFLSRPLQALALAAAVFLTGCAIKPASPSGEAAEPPAQTTPAAENEPARLRPSTEGAATGVRPSIVSPLEMQDMPGRRIAGLSAPTDI